MKDEIKLNLGCGKTRLPGFVNVDCKKGDSVDMVWDLNKFPYPWPDNSVSEVVMDNVLEHLDKPKKVIEELWRICHNGAIVRIMVPWHGLKMALWNPEHTRDFMPQWFDAFDSNNKMFNAYARCVSDRKVDFRVNRIKKKAGKRIFKRIKFVTHMSPYETEVTMEVVK